MPDVVSAAEKLAKTVRTVFLAAVENAAFLLDGLCRAPECLGCGKPGCAEDCFLTVPAPGGFHCLAPPFECLGCVTTADCTWPHKQASEAERPHVRLTDEVLQDSSPVGNTLQGIIRDTPVGRGTSGGFIAGCDGKCTDCICPKDSAASPQAAVPPTTVEASVGEGSTDGTPEPSVEHPPFGEATAVVAYRVICPSCNNHLTGLWPNPERAEQAFWEKGGFCRTCKPSLIPK